MQGTIVKLVAYVCLFLNLILWLLHNGKCMFLLIPATSLLFQQTSVVGEIEIVNYDEKKYKRSVCLSVQATFHFMKYAH